MPTAPSYLTAGSSFCLAFGVPLVSLSGSGMWVTVAELGNHQGQRSSCCLPPQSWEESSPLNRRKGQVEA